MPGEHQFLFSDIYGRNEEVAASLEVHLLMSITMVCRCTPSWIIVTCTSSGNPLECFCVDVMVLYTIKGNYNISSKLMCITVVDTVMSILNIDETSTVVSEQKGIVIKGIRC